MVINLERDCPACGGAAGGGAALSARTRSMAPKRRRVVKTTRKVVRETVRVSVIDSDTEGINTRNQSSPDFEGETEELQATHRKAWGLKHRILSI